jgi:uncharacterized protein (TIGR02466 family)
MGAEELVPLFATPLYIKMLDTELPMQDAKAIMENEAYIRVSADNGWRTSNSSLLDKPEYESLKLVVDRYIEHYAYNLIKMDTNLKLRMVSSWCVKHKKGDWAHRHLHSNSVFSGVLYLKTDLDAGEIEFIKAIGTLNLFSPAIVPKVVSYNVYNSSSWTVTPKNGMLLIFPSCLEHEVSVSKSNEDRFVVAFNYYPTGQIGAENGLSKLHFNPQKQQ